MGVPVGRVASYNEKAAATSGVLIEDGYRLVQRMIQEDPLSIVL
jgi:hypothetical protein